MIAALSDAVVEYPGRGRALGPFSLTVAAGEIVAIAGPSGCGKSTALRLLAGLEQPTYGEVEREVGRGKTALVFQAPTLMPWADAATNVALPLQLADRPRGERAERVAHALRRVGLADAARAYPAGTRLGQWVSPPFDQYVKVVLHISYNRGADVLACLVGVRAGLRDCENGLGRATRIVQRLGVPGLQFRVVNEGKGEPITSVDAALLDYVGTLEDGTVFDNSESHGGAQPFTMGQVFPGFAEAMAKMREGGRYHFTMPKSLAFAGQAPAGFTGDTLTFDVQVRKIVRNGAAMMQAAQGAQQEPTDRGPPEQGPPEQRPQQP